MEPRVQSLAAIFDLNTDLLVNCAADLTDAQAQQRLAGGGNSIAFLMAHLIDARYFLAKLLGAPLPNPLESALAEVNSIEEVESLPGLDELLRAWDTVSAHLSEVLRRLTARELDASTALAFPIPGGTVADAVAFLAQHDSYHLGQISFLRRQLGLASMSYDRPASGAAGPPRPIP